LFSTLVELGIGQLGSDERFFSESMHQNIGRAVQEQPEAVGRKTVAGGAVAVEREFVVLDKVFLIKFSVRPRLQ